MAGKLIIVSTPIGNLEDITLRALRFLREVDLIACEDTRKTRKLLTRYDIKKPLTSYHEHNEVQKTPVLAKKIIDGATIALVTDAGTPGISDPGYRLVKACVESDIEVVAVPGATALVCALNLSGLPSSRFSFFGFLPKTELKKRSYLETINNYPDTLIFYESPNRVVSTLKSMLVVLGDRRCAVSRELTKLHEETIRGSISDVLDVLERRESIKGELTIALEGHIEETNEEVMERAKEALEEMYKNDETLKDSVGKACNIFGIGRNKIYKLAQEIWGK